MTPRETTNTHRRDRRGRGVRGLLLPLNLPGRRTRAEKFDQLVVEIAMDIARRAHGKADGIEIAVEDVPPSDPAPWERGSVALSRSFPADRALGVAPRVVIYRRPVERRAYGVDRARLINDVLTSEIAILGGFSPEDIDPNPTRF